MIIVQLKGGLGNQMFQYATGRRLACMHDVCLKLDLSWFASDICGVTPRSFALAPFSIIAESATEQEISRLYEPHVGRLRSLINNLRRDYRRTHIRAHDSRFDPSILGLPDDVLLDGHWQSEKYFHDIAHLIRGEFKLRMEPVGQNREVISEINGYNAISLHIRRGDYVTDVKTAAWHGVCSYEYYKNAVEVIVSKVENPHFFVFSDDPEWVQERFKLSYPMTIVDNNGADFAYEDLRLMSLCRHQIIANSSFSWWGAWLNPRPDKIVIAPSRWFNDETIDTSDLIPASWLRINQ